MPKPSKPTGAQLYKRWIDGGWSFEAIGRWAKIDSDEVEDAIRAYLKGRKCRTERGKVCD